MSQRVIEEGYTKSLVARTKEAKLAALTGAFAIKIARQKQDPLYEKLVRFKKAYKLVKRQIIAKYGTKAMLAARQAALRFGKQQ